MKDLDVKKAIFDLLHEEGCKISISCGIVYVTDLSGQVWSFTVPLREE